MIASFPEWLLYSDWGLVTRVLAGVAVFSILAAVDLRRNRGNARRWKEYLFLLAGVAAAMCYGIVNDQITVTISSDYYYFGKGLFETFHYERPEMAVLRLEAMKIGLKATWTAGLLFAVAMLVANNPWKRWAAPQLPYRTLLPMLLWPLAAAAVAGALLGLGFFLFGAGFQPEWQSVLETPARHRAFVTVWGIHLGGYVGGLIGTILACRHILILRKRLLAGTVKNATDAADATNAH